MVRRCAIILFVLCGSAAGITSDLDGNGWVDFLDYAILAANWQKETGISPAGADLNSDGIVDVNDLAIFADEWLTGPTPPNIPPTAAAVGATVTQYLLNRVTLAGTDDGLPNPPAKLRYIITSLPADGNLYDVAPGGRRISSVPHSLVANSPYVAYYCTTTTPTPATFDYRCNDYDANSNSATVTLTKAAYVKDNLSFDGRGYVTVPDNSALDANNFNLYFWLRTTRAYGGIISKREPNGPGMEVLLWHGCPAIILYDNDGGIIAAVSSPLLGGQRVDTGQWYCVGMAVYAGQIEIGIRDEAMNMRGSVAAVSTAGFTTDNAGPLLIGTDGQQGFNGSIDRVAMWKNPGVPSFLMAGTMVEARTGTTWTFAAAPTVEWRFTEATGSTVTDSKLSLVGEFSDPNHVTWYPQGPPPLNIVPAGGSR